MPQDLFQHRRLRLLELLRELSYQERDVVLASGRKSTFYVDCRQTVLTAEGHFLVGSLFNHIIAGEAPEAKAVGGISVGADPLASATSLMSQFGSRILNAFYIRKEPKKHGTSQWLEGTASLAPDTSPSLEPRR